MNNTTLLKESYFSPLIKNILIKFVKDIRLELERWKRDPKLSKLTLAEFAVDKKEKVGEIHGNFKKNMEKILNVTSFNYDFGVNMFRDIFARVPISSINRIIEDRKNKKEDVIGLLIPLPSLYAAAIMPLTSELFFYADEDHLKKRIKALMDIQVTKDGYRFGSKFAINIIFNVNIGFFVDTLHFKDEHIAAIMAHEIGHCFQQIILFRKKAALEGISFMMKLQTRQVVNLFITLIKDVASISSRGVVDLLIKLSNDIKTSYDHRLNLEIVTKRINKEKKKTELEDENVLVIDPMHYIALFLSIIIIVTLAKSRWVLVILGNPIIRALHTLIIRPSVLLKKYSQRYASEYFADYYTTSVGLGAEFAQALIQLDNFATATQPKNYGPIVRFMLKIPLIRSLVAFLAYERDADTMNREQYESNPKRAKNILDILKIEKDRKENAPRRAEIEESIKNLTQFVKEENSKEPAFKLAKMIEFIASKFNINEAERRLYNILKENGVDVIKDGKTLKIKDNNLKTDKYSKEEKEHIQFFHKNLSDIYEASVYLQDLADEIAKKKFTKK